MRDDENAARIQLAPFSCYQYFDTLIHEGDAEVLSALLENPNMQEPQVSRLLERLDLSAELIGAIAKEGKWNSSESIRLRLARHPRTPRPVAISVLRQLYLFDLVKVSLLPSAPADIRRSAEEIIVARLPQLPIGEKLTLARRGPSRVAGAVLAEGHAQAVKLALANSFLTESQVLKVIAKPEISARVIMAISQHAKWSIRYNVRVALVRQTHTPVPALLEFLPDLALNDLKDVAAFDQLSAHSRKYVEQELIRRAEKPK